MRTKNHSAARSWRRPLFISMLALVALAPISPESRAQSKNEPYTFTTLAGGGGLAIAEQSGVAPKLSPNALALDSAGNLYVADTGNHAIRKVTPNGVITTLAGLPGTPGAADGPGSEARFFFPDKVMVDSAGNI